jgi:GT2 family glycosyltransferase
MPPAAPLVYCIVLNYNGREVLAETLETLGAMTYPNFRVAVADNGSTDGSAAFVRERFPAVELIETGGNLGVTGGRNIAMKYAIDRGASTTTSRRTRSSSPS